jgi:hypothetical protein
MVFASNISQTSIHLALVFLRISKDYNVRQCDDFEAVHIIGQEFLQAG